MTRKIKSLYPITSQIFIVRAQKGVVCWSTEKYQREESIGIGLKSSDEEWTYISMEGLSVLIDKMENDEETHILRRTTYQPPVMCKTPCIVCEEEIKTEVDLIAISEFEGILDPWIHVECIDELSDIVETKLNEHVPNILAHNV